MEEVPVLEGVTERVAIVAVGVGVTEGVPVPVGVPVGVPVSNGV